MTETTFRNRILSYGVKPADQFLAHPKNARIHPTFQREAMKAALDTVGFVAPVLEAKSGYLVDGHERIWQALQNSNADVPYVVLDIDESEESYVLATFDPLTGLANYDAEQLGALLQEINTDSPALQQMLSELAGSHNLYVPTLDELGDTFGEHQDRSFWPFIRVQVSPDTYQRYVDLMKQIPGTDDALKIEQILDAVDETVFEPIGER